MSGVNKQILLGRLGKDPELSYTGSGKAVCKFSVATGKGEYTQWHNIVVWEKLAELCNQYLKKGRQAYVEGETQHRSWENKEGRKVITTEVVARTVQFIGGQAEATEGSSQKPLLASQMDTSDIPF